MRPGFQDLASLANKSSISSLDISYLTHVPNQGNNNHLLLISLNRDDEHKEEQCLGQSKSSVKLAALIRL